MLTDQTIGNHPPSNCKPVASNYRNSTSSLPPVKAAHYTRVTGLEIQSRIYYTSELKHKGVTCSCLALTPGVCCCAAVHPRQSKVKSTTLDITRKPPPSSLLQYNRTWPEHDNQQSQQFIS